MMHHNPLKLVAKDLEDLIVISSHLQDAILPLTAMSYDERKKTFSLLADRFCWEHDSIQNEEGKDFYHRVHSAIQLHNVNKVEHKNFPHPQDAHHQLLNLLCIKNEMPYVHFIFSGGYELRLHVDELEFYLKDIHEPYPTKHKPKHIHDHLDDIESEGII